MMITYKEELELIEALKTTIEYHIEHTSFIVKDCEIDGIVKLEPKDFALNEIFSSEWYYSVWDEPLLIQGDEITFKISDWKTKSIENIQKVKDVE